MAAQPNDLYKLLNTEDVPMNIAEQFPHLGISASDLKIPTQELVTRIFKAYLEAIGIVVPEVVKHDQIPPNMYPDLYSEVLPSSNLHYILNIILEANSYHEFSFSDITHPNPTRTALILAILNNFDMFCYNLKADLELNVADLDDNRRKYMAFRKRKEQIRQELNHRAMNRAQRENILKNNKEKSEIKGITLDQLLRKQKSMFERELDYNSQLQKAKQIDDILVQQIQSADEKITTLHKEIVPDPENLVKEPKLMKEQLDQEVWETERKVKRNQLKKAGIERYNLVIETQQHQSKMLKNVRILEETLARKNSNDKDKESVLKTITKTVESNQDKMSKLLKGNQERQDEILTLELKIDAKATQMKKSLMAANQEQNQVKTKVEIAYGLCSKVDKQLIEYQNEIEKNFEIQSEISQHADEQNIIIAKKHKAFFTDLKAVLAQLDLDQHMDELDISSSEFEKENYNHENILK